MTDVEPQGYYAASAGTAAERPALSGRHMADICVIGAGYTGLSAALHAAEMGARVIVLEAHQAGYGASGRNGGQIHSGLRKDQRELEAWLGTAHARDLWALSEEAKALLRALVTRHHIPCDLKSGLITAAHSARAARALAQDTEHLVRNYGYRDLRTLDAAQTAEQTGTLLYQGGRFDHGGGHLHPLLYARGLARAAQSAGAEIFERSAAQTIDWLPGGVGIRCASGTVMAGRAILATDAFSGALAPAI